MSTTASPTTTAAPPVATPTGDVTAPASRPGGLPAAARTTAPPAPSLVSTVTYPDGIKVRVASARQGVVTEAGPGSLTGAPRTEFTITVSNGSTRPIDLTSVVVSAFYGMPPLQAAPIYDAGVEDFGSTVAPGASATARYAFSIPTSDRGDTLLVVDLDGRHGTAVFRGAVR